MRFNGRHALRREYRAAADVLARRRLAELDQVAPNPRPRPTEPHATPSTGAVGRGRARVGAMAQRRAVRSVLAVLASPAAAPLVAVVVVGVFAALALGALIGAVLFAGREVEA